MEKRDLIDKNEKSYATVNQHKNDNITDEINNHLQSST